MFRFQVQGLQTKTYVLPKNAHESKNTINTYRKMKKIILCMGALAFFSIGIGNAQERFVSDQPSNRKAVLEEFTGVNCPNCPAGHVVANKIHSNHPEDFFAINFHAGPYAAPIQGQYDFRTNYGSVLDTKFNKVGYPSGMVNRRSNNGSELAMARTSWSSAAEGALGLPSPVNVAAKASLDWETRTLDVTVQMYYTSNSAKSENFLNVALLQDYIMCNQAGASANPEQYVNGQYLHMHAFRDFLTGQWGDTIQQTTQGSLVEKTYSYTVPEMIGDIPVDLANISLVAYIAEGEEEIYTACQAEMTHENSPSAVLSVYSGEPVQSYTCDAKVKLSFPLYINMAVDSVKSITYVCKTDAGNQEFTHEFDTALASHSSVVFETEAFELGEANKSEVVAWVLEKVNGKDYDASTDCRLSVQMQKMWAHSSTPELEFLILQDRYGDDITWEVTDTANEVVFSGGPYRDLGAAGTFLNTEPLRLSEGCYALKVNDAENDGINNKYGEGNLSLKDADGNLIWENDGTYGSGLLLMLSTEGKLSANSPLCEVMPVSVYPNPAREQAVLSFELAAAQSVNLSVYDLNGRKVKDFGSMYLSAGVNEIPISLTGMSEGLYMVNLQSNQGRMVGKLVVR